MGASHKAQELRDLISLAIKLRESAAQTDDARYIDLFIRSAEALEARANNMAFGTPLPGSQPAHAHIDVTC